MRFADEQLTGQTVWSAFKYLNKNHNKRTAGSFMASTHHHSRSVREEVYRAQSQIHLGTVIPADSAHGDSLLVDRLDQQGHLFTCAVSDEEEPV